jgi:hypothetical protein
MLVVCRLRTLLHSSPHVSTLPLKILNSVPQMTQLRNLGTRTVRFASNTDEHSSPHVLCEADASNVASQITHRFKTIVAFPKVAVESPKWRLPNVFFTSPEIRQQAAERNSSTCLPTLAVRPCTLCLKPIVTDLLKEPDQRKRETSPNQ